MQQGNDCQALLPLFLGARSETPGGRQTPNIPWYILLAAISVHILRVPQKLGQVP